MYMYMYVCAKVYMCICIRIGTIVYIMYISLCMHMSDIIDYITGISYNILNQQHICIAIYFKLIPIL